ncbi:glycosyltransferase [Leptospira brenneri]|uniref:Glycosyltransferase n=1 Tax=Leptospira brenneri TaxID=2023182 RepID=A0A2M9Y242_9LEPT|nr:glycosyltransferase [Leptospira brenneri]PJZ45503.1 hypothetical protein CH361_10785 [Leptospira brenneri]TGK91995.1 glycosyltransferase [Leptospira brenneri]
MIIGIDASRNKSGGAITHIIGILNSFDVDKHKIEKIHIWSYQKLLDQIPDAPWLKKHSPRFLSFNLIFQLFWQRFLLHREAKKVGCDIMFDSDAGSISKFKPFITMSQDLLNFEKDSLKYYKFGIARIRLFFLYYIQIASFRNSVGTIFLTNYSSKVIQNHTGDLKNYRIIPHGIDDAFGKIHKLKENLSDSEIKILYISPIQEYKNHINVIKAVNVLRSNYPKVSITFAGKIDGDFGRSVMEFSRSIDSSLAFINFVGNIRHDELPTFTKEFDIIVFASSVENMPITLIESMRLGMPIACSDRGPMPEVLKDAGIYFDPDRPDSIEAAIRLLIDNNHLRTSLAKKAREYSLEYTWERCSFETFSFLCDSV